MIVKMELAITKLMEAKFRFPFFDSGFIKNDIDILLSKKTMVRNKGFQKFKKFKKKFKASKIGLMTSSSKDRQISLKLKI